MRLKPRELFIDLPESDPENVPIVEGIKALKAMPGKVVVAKYPPRDKSHGLYLPDEAQQKYRPDAGVVIASGDKEFTPNQTVLCKYWSGIHYSPYKSTAPDYTFDPEFTFPFRLRANHTLVLPDAPPKGDILRSKEVVTQTGIVAQGCLPTGSRVLFEKRNAVGLLGTTEYTLEWLDGYLMVPDRNIVATEHADGFEWEYLQVLDAKDIYMTFSRDEWQPADRYALIERDMAMDGPVLLTELGSRPYRINAVMRSCVPESGLYDGLRVLVDPDPNGALFFKFGDQASNLQLVEKSRIWSAIHEDT